MKKILVPTAGGAPAKETAAYVVRIAKIMGAELTALHVLPKGEPAESGEEALRIFSDLGVTLGVNVSAVVGHGNVVSQIIDCATENNIDLIVMGASQGKVVSQWVSADVMERAGPPVVVIPHELGLGRLHSARNSLQHVQSSRSRVPTKRRDTTMQRTSIPTLYAEAVEAVGEETALLQGIRKQGGVPAVVLGRHATRQILSLDAAQVEQATQHDEHPVVRIELAAETVWARVSDVAHNPRGLEVQHVEMTRLPKGEVVVVDVPIEVHRKSAGRWSDAPFQKLESVRLEGPVEMLPDVLEVNAHRLQPHESITLGDLNLPRYCEPVDLALDTPVVTVWYYGERSEAEKETAPHKF